MAHVEDRWTIPGDGKRRTRGPRYGQGSRWLAVWNEADGRRRKQAFDVKDAATAHLEHVGTTQRSGTYIAADRGRLTVEAMSARWLTEQVHQRSTSLDNIRIRLRKNIVPSLGAMQLADVDRTAVQAAVTAWIADGYAPATVRVAYIYMAGVFSLAVGERRIRESPCQKINLPPLSGDPVTPMTTLRVQELTAALWVPYRRMAVLAAATGMRGAELRGLGWDRVTPTADGAIIRVDRQMTGNSSTHPTFGPPKTKAGYRPIGIGPATLAAMGERHDGLVLTGRFGGALTRGASSTAWRHAAGPLGIPTGTGWHELRHYHASLLIAGGASPVAVAHRLGHKDAVETLKTYAHLWIDDDDRMRDASDGVITIPEPPHSPR